MDNIHDIFQLDECLDWIIENKFRRIVVQLKKEDLKRSADISTYLQDKFLRRNPYQEDAIDKKDEELDVYVTQANTCCVDLLVTQHISNLDAIIHLGKVCLSKPQLKNIQQVAKPVLFDFTHPRVSKDLFQKNLNTIFQEIDSLTKSDANCKMCVLYDTDMIDYVRELQVKLDEAHLTRDSVEIAKLRCPDSNWQTTKNNRSFFITGSNVEIFHNFVLARNSNDYNCAIYIGDRLSTAIILSGPSKLIKFTCKDSVSREEVNVSKVLNKRMALVGRLKDQDELKIGVIITNPLPNMDEIAPRLRSYSEKRKHTLYFITMVQTIDECKIGNFDLCDAFIVVNACTCSTILESLVFNRPIISEIEFKLACGLEAEYGRVLWPGSSDHLSIDDEINKRKVSDVSLALVHTRNELLERCSQARLNKWSGLEYKASVGDSSSGDGTNNTKENLTVEEGLTGIASSYMSEPLKKEED